MGRISSAPENGCDMISHNDRTLYLHNCQNNTISVSVRIYRKAIFFAENFHRVQHFRVSKRANDTFHQ